MEKIVFFGAGPYVDEIIEVLKRKLEVVRTVSSKEKLDDKLIDELKSTDARVAILASFGQIIPDVLLNTFEFGILNIHPSLLPTYRGPTPVQSALLNGDETTGVSIIKLDNEVDHGPILAQVEQKIEDDDTSESLYKKLFKVGAELLVENLPRYLSGELEPTEQDDSKATFTKPLSRESGLIDINSNELEIRNSKLEIARKIRAYYPWPGVWFKTDISGNEKIIKLLPGDKIQVEGKKPMSLKDFKNGYSQGEAILAKIGVSV